MYNSCSSWPKAGVIRSLVPVSPPGDLRSQS